MSTLDRRVFLKGAVVLGSGAALGGFQLRLAADAAAVSAPTIASCDTWGAAPPKSAIVVLNQRPTKIIVHHTASSNSIDYSQAHAFAMARSVQSWHFGNGWADSGQQFTISRGGYVMEGRHESLPALRGGTQQVRGAHCTGQNDVAVGIENEGTYTSVTPPTALYNQLVSLCAYTCQQYGIPASQLYGHRDFNATSCPGDVLYGMLPQLRSDVAAQIGGGGGGTRTWPVVRSGHSGERVRTIQYHLRGRGYTITVDGIFGSGTASTVRSFQSSKALAVDGVVGPQTWEALVVTVRNGSSGDAVHACQSQLKAHGYSIAVDGAFGPATESALRSFQRSVGMAGDGLCGPTTWSKLVA